MSGAVRMGPSEAVRAGVRRSLSISGRARRAEYWWFHLFLAGCLVLGVVLLYVLPDGFGVLLLVAYVWGFVASTTALVRRLHDTGRSGWWWLLTFVPFASIVPIVFACLDSEPGDNDHGTNPKGVAGGYHSWGAPVPATPPPA